MGVSRLWVLQLEQGKPTVQLDLVLRALQELDIRLTLDAPESTKPSINYRNIPSVDLDAIIRETSGPVSP